MLRDAINNIFLLKQINFFRLKKKWRKINKHNFSQISNIFDMSRVKVGKGTYGDIEVYSFDNECTSCLEIGSFCSIAPKVVFILDGEHNYKNISTYPFLKRYYNKLETLSKGNICIKDDVWIGFGATILSGVTIGQGAIIGAGSIVAKDIPPYAIYADNRIIKYRFSPEIIEKLLKVDFSNLNISEVDFLYKEINMENIDEVIEKVFT